MIATTIKKLTLLVGLTAALATSVPAATQGTGPTFNDARPYLYALCGIGAVLAYPFFYNFNYYTFAPKKKINNDARALLARIRQRYGASEQIVKRNNPAELRTYVSGFFEQRNRYDGVIRRVVCLAPQSDECSYFNWATAPYLYQLLQYAEAVTDPELKRGLEAAYAALNELNERVASMES